MNNDVKIISKAREDIRKSVCKFSKDYCDFAGESVGETIGNVLDGQLRAAKKLADLEKLFNAADKQKQTAEQMLDELLKTLKKK